MSSMIWIEVRATPTNLEGMVIVTPSRPQEHGQGPWLVSTKAVLPNGLGGTCVAFPAGGFAKPEPAPKPSQAKAKDAAKGKRDGILAGARSMTQDFTAVELSMVCGASPSACGQALGGAGWPARRIGRTGPCTWIVAKV
jgi:hypothetical protein